MRRFSLQFMQAVLLLILAPVSCLAEQALVAVASNFSAPARAIVSAFERETGHSVRLSQGSSGKLYAQILNGAPFDLFLSADSEKPTLLIEAGLAVEDSQRTYAFGALALWASKEGVLINAETLRAGNFSRLAQANPRLAPYGLAAQQVINRLALTDALAEKQVTGENISQAYQFVTTGNAELGFVALSQVMNGDGPIRGSLWRVPQELYDPIAQDAVLLNRALNNIAAQEFMRFLMSAEANGILANYGYSLDSDAVAAARSGGKKDG
ncbi:MAG: molybdate ABC transporter substrate-binding protein [Pseudohongiellaceae bacterium]